MLRAENKAPRTIDTYALAVDQLATHLARRPDAPARPPAWAADLHEFFVALQEQGKLAATRNQRYRSLHSFFAFLVEEGEVPAHPMEQMRPPHVPERPVPVLDEDQIRALLGSVKGRGFLEVRDTPIIRMLLDTGMRRSELTGLAVDDVDLDQDVALVLGKGRRERACPFGKKTAMALDRNLRARSRHTNVNLPSLWLAQKGALTNPGLQKDVGAPRPAGWHRPHPPAPVPPHLHPRVAVRRRPRGRPHALSRLEEPRNAPALRRLRRRRQSPRSLPPPLPRRPLLRRGTESTP